MSLDPMIPLCSGLLKTALSAATGSRYRLPCLAALCGLLPACTSLRAVRVAISPEIATGPVRVDIRPSTPELARVSAREYWRPGSPVRAHGENHPLVFGPTAPYVQEVKQQNWHAKKLLVIADVPGIGGGDAYTRLELPTFSWYTQKETEVKVSLAGVRSEPPVWPKWP